MYRAAVASTLLAVAACGGGGSAVPQEFDGPFFGIVEGPGPDGIVLESQMAADDGTAALLTLEVTAPPPAEAPGGSASVECDGEMVEGPLVQDAQGGTGTVEIDGLGTVALTIEHNRAVAMERAQPPLCTEHTGTWKGTSGELDGREGTFVAVGHHANHSDDEHTAQLTLLEVTARTASSTNYRTRRRCASSPSDTAAAPTASTRDRAGRLRPGINEWSLR